MTVIMQAKEAAEQTYHAVRTKVEEWKRKGVHPLLAVIMVEGDPASVHYVKAKQKIAEKLGVAFVLHPFKADVAEEELLRRIAGLNDDPSVHGIMLELPLPDHLSTSRIVQAPSPLKDIDGVTPRNKLAVMTGDAGLYPATPQACIRLLQHYGYPLAGKNVTVIGRGQTVGLPLFHMLQREHATVTVCHSRTPDLALHLGHADIAFVAVGRRGVIRRDMVHSDLVVVDAGINTLEDGKVVGDAAADVVQAVAAISPVPGGVGTLTTAILFENLMKAVDLQYGEVTF